MESAVRYDFSFPPKSNSLNSNNMHTVSSNASSCGPNTQHISHSHSHTIFRNNYQQHHQQQQHHQHQQHFNNNNHNNNQHQVASFNQNNCVNNTVGLSKSASTSLLSCVSNTTNNNNPKYANANFCNSCNTVKMPDSSINTNNNNSNAFNLNNKSNYINNGSYTSKSSIKNSSSQHHPAIIGAPATPKDGNCSFTFDDLKNTLAFMEDSPLISATNSSNTPHHNRHATPGAAAPTAPPPPTQLLTLKLETNTSQSEVNGGSGGGGGGGSTSVSSLSSSCSSSGLSSSSSSSSSSSCNSCYVPPYMPKSNSNPMLVSSSIGGGSNSSSTSPTSITSGVKKSHCTCSKPSSNQASQYQNQNNVLDMLMKKSSSDLEHHQIQQHYHQQHQPYHHNPYGTNQSLITPVNSLNLNSNNLLTNIQQQNSSTQQNGNNGINVAIESAAKKYRCAAQISEASCSWKGKLPPKQYKIAIVYSTKVFVGGLPWDITEEDILKEFGVFGPCRVEWTNKEKFNLLSNNSNNQQQQQEADNNGSYQSFRTNRSMGNLQAQKNSQSDINNAKHRLSPGFAYVIYEGENSVRGLVGNCIEDYQNGRDRVEYYFKISTRRVRNKEVQIIPWILADNNFALCTPKELDPKKTVFVGNLHGTMTARDLAHIMNELFGCVVYAGIDIDKLKYPIGSGRVTFSHQQNFMRAVRAAFVDIQSNKFSKRIQIDPYLEDVQCCLCYSDKGIYFCRDFQCFNYYCGGCWDKQHSYNQLGNHKPLMRKREDKLM